MRIDRIKLENFRCFNQQEFLFKPGFNLLVGANGVGKTAILDGLAIAIGSLFLGFDSIKARHIQNPDVRRVRHEHEGLPDIQPQYPCTVSAVGHLDAYRDDGSEFQRGMALWSRSLRSARGRTTSEDASVIKSIAADLLERVRAGRPVDLPVLGYYGTGRLWVFKRDRADKLGALGNRLDGYTDCLDPASNQKQLVNWMKRQALVSAQKGVEIKHVQAIESAVCRCIEGLERFYFDLQYDELRLVFGDDELMPFDFLSDGYRNTVAMVADIAWRASVLNPHHGAGAPAAARGVVLIDELDLHLHPKWQRRITSDLRAAFPKIQFIATTHSPFIIQSLEDGHLIDLSEPKGASWRSKSIEDIAEEIQGVEGVQRSEKFHAMMAAAERYFELLEELRDAKDERVAELKRRLDREMELFASSPAYAALLKMERVAAETAREQADATD